MCSSRNSPTRTGGVGAKCWLTCKLRDDPLGSQARAKQQGLESRLRSDKCIDTIDSILQVMLSRKLKIVN